MSDCPTLKFGDSIAFHSTGFISWRIRSRTNGWANHSAFVMDAENATEATFGKGLAMANVSKLVSQPCVVLRPMGLLGIDWSFTEADKHAVWDAWASEGGSKYDWKAIAGFMFCSWRNSWADKSGWFCSEWVGACYDLARFPLLNGTGDLGSFSPSQHGSSGRLRPIWHCLPEKIANGMNLKGVPNANG